MSNLQVISVEDSGHWDDIVRSFKNYDVFYLSGYVKAFQHNGDGEPLLFYFADGQTRAINVVMKRDISEYPRFHGNIDSGELFDLSTPYGYGGFIIEGEQKARVKEAYNAYCISNRIVCEFVRFSLFSEYVGHFDGVSESRTHNIVRSLTETPEQLLKDFEHKVRKNIKRAVAKGLTFEVDLEGKRIEEFLEIYESTMKRNNAADTFYFDRGFFNILNTMKDNVAYFHVLHEGMVISTELVLYADDYCYSYLGGTSSKFYDMRPNDYLKYGIILWAHEKGLKNFVLGGGHRCDDGIFQYKKSFAPNGITNYYIGKKIFDQKTYDMLVDKAIQGMSNNENTGFFPAYCA